MLFIFLKIYLFILEREREHATGRAEGEEENLKQAPHPAQNQTQGSILRPWDRNLSQNQESEAQPTEPPRRPGSVIWKSNKLIPANIHKTRTYKEENMWFKSKDDLSINGAGKIGQLHAKEHNLTTLSHHTQR